MTAARHAGEGGRRNVNIQVRVNPTEKREIEEFMIKYSYSSMSDFFRRTALGYQHVDRSILEDTPKDKK